MSYQGSVELWIYSDGDGGYYSELHENPDFPDSLPHLVKIGALTQAATQLSMKQINPTDEGE